MIFLTELYAAVLPLLLSIIAAWLAKALVAAAAEAKRRWGIEIEARHRDALHSALMSGIRAALGRGLSGQAAIAAAISYAGQSVPDALDRLQPDAAVLADLAAAKLREAMEKAPFIAVDLAAAAGEIPHDAARFDLGPALAITLAALNIVNILYTWWRTRDQNVETRFKAGSERMDRLDGRLASVEQTLRAQPTKEDMHQLGLLIEGLRGDVRELRAAQSAATDAGKRQDIVLARVEQYLLERK